MLKSVVFDRFIWSKFSPESTQTILSELRGVEVLEMRGVYIRGVEHVMDIVYTFPSLKTLSLIGLVLVPKPLQPSFPLSAVTLGQGPLFQLDTLDLSNQANEFIIWLLARDPTPTIRILRYFPQSSHPSHFRLNQLLSVVGNSIQSMELTQKVFPNTERMYRLHL
jgi:hypothetical protein